MGKELWERPDNGCRTDARRRTTPRRKSVMNGVAVSVFSILVLMVVGVWTVISISKLQKELEDERKSNPTLPKGATGYVVATHKEDATLFVLVAVYREDKRSVYWAQTEGTFEMGDVVYAHQKGTIQLCI